MERMLATPADAEIILGLYELRTEAEMRKARAWMTGEFWPLTTEEFFAVAENPADPHNAWMRQVISYWEMAAAMVVHGAVSAELFVDCNGEGFFSVGQIFAHSGWHSGEESGVPDEDVGAGESVFSRGAALRGGAEECGSPAQEHVCPEEGPRPKFLAPKSCPKILMETRNRGESLLMSYPTLSSDLLWAERVITE
jgi:hypothetical protein